MDQEQENPVPFRSLFPEIPSEVWGLFLNMMGVVSNDLDWLSKRHQDYLRLRIQRAFELWEPPRVVATPNHCDCPICCHQVEHDMEQTEWPAPHAN